MHLRSREVEEEMRDRGPESLVQAVNWLGQRSLMRRTVRHFLLGMDE